MHSLLDAYKTLKLPPPSINAPEFVIGALGPMKTQNGGQGHEAGSSGNSPTEQLRSRSSSDPVLRSWHVRPCRHNLAQRAVFLLRGAVRAVFSVSTSAIVCITLPWASLSVLRGGGYFTVPSQGALDAQASPCCSAQDLRAALTLHKRTILRSLRAGRHSITTCSFGFYPVPLPGFFALMTEPLNWKPAS